MDQNKVNKNSINCAKHTFFKNNMLVLFLCKFNVFNIFIIFDFFQIFISRSTEISFESIDMNFFNFCLTFFKMSKKIYKDFEKTLNSFAIKEHRLLDYTQRNLNSQDNYLEITKY